jgi:DNA end-binding protein Ku
VKAKIEGGEIKRTPTATKTSGEVVDLLAALQRSVDAAKTARGETPETPETKAPAKKAGATKPASKSTTKKAPAKKTPAKKTTAKKTPAKKATKRAS